MNRPDAAHTNPVVAKTNAIVLCLHCFGDNSDQFLSSVNIAANSHLKP